MDAQTVAKRAIEIWFSRWVAPVQLHLNGGTNFESILIQESNEVLETCETQTTAFHSKGNGPAERTNRTLKTLLKPFVSHEKA
ncbi:unnamed protein product [Schistosoma curassoni]|uniref:Integrase catalytic domain-containing protein n=1 Tax=Schistosoma curassoni TaxID=6186 RepID=A0A183K7P3_9TREM|nr:unnamed protein product [Schistosoma curassoni]